MAEPSSGIYKFTTTYSNTPLAPVQQDEKGTTITLSLSVPEAMFLAFVSGGLQSSIKKGDSHAILSTSNEMQRDFTNWSTKNFPHHGYTQKQLELVTLVTSLWEKSKVCVNIEKNKNAIKHEEEQRKIGEAITQRLLREGIPCKAFTARQVKCLLDYRFNDGE
jgi:hypothetical protein